MRLRAIAAALLLVITLAGCGGDGDGGEEAAPQTETAAPADTGGQDAVDGETVFTSNCGSCHTLAAAGTSGTTGPNLDEVMPDAARVEEQVRNGGGGMPAFEGQLSDQEIQAVAQYVADSAGG